MALMTDICAQIRRAGSQDLPTLAKFGRALANLHATFDEQRFVAPDEAALRQFFEGELARKDAVIVIAEVDSAPIGYAFVRLEPASIEALMDPSAWLHDIYIIPEARARGAGRRLVEAAFDAARSVGSKTLMLGVSPRNASGRALFERMGFRPTMIEMSAPAK
jgi:GNAT superfamily N-acetyltransferase